MKLLVLFLLISIVVGAIVGWFKGGDGYKFENTVAFAALGVAMAGVFSMFVVAVIFVFS